MLRCYICDELLVLGASGHDGEDAGVESGERGDGGHCVGWMTVGVKGAEMPGKGVIVDWNVWWRLRVGVIGGLVLVVLTHGCGF